MLAAKSSVHFLEHDPELAHRWSISKAQEWFDKHGWVVGCNYIPSNAINQLEMWPVSYTHLTLPTNREV